MPIRGEPDELRLSEMKCVDPWVAEKPDPPLLKLMYPQTGLQQGVPPGGGFVYRMDCDENVSRPPEELCGWASVRVDMLVEVWSTPWRLAAVIVAQ